MKHIIFTTILLSGLLTTSCHAQSPAKTLRFEHGKICMLLDSVAAGKAINYDQTDGYFDKVGLSEMSIQMQKALPENADRAEWVRNYQAFLKTDVSDFTDEDTRFITGVMETVFKTADGVSPRIFPDTLLLIKTKGRHYGEGVWYTRENCIVIPTDVLERRKTSQFTTTMFHELFHVWSRLNPAQSDKTYQLVGFEDVGFNNLVLPPDLAARALFNPDGVDFAQKITLAQADSSTIMAIPIIYSNHLGWTTAKKTFFAYLEFNLFQIEKQSDGKYAVLVKEDGFSSTLNLQQQPDFFRQIKDNTGYIIHPDEVLADNFSFIMLEKMGQNVSLKFSEEGKKLIQDLEALLKE